MTKLYFSLLRQAIKALEEFEAINRQPDGPRQCGSCGALKNDEGHLPCGH